MQPDDRDLDEEIRGHLALSIKDRIERGEDPEAARLAALREFGYVPHAPRFDARGLASSAGSTRPARSGTTSGSPCARSAAPRASPPRWS